MSKSARLCEELRAEGLLRSIGWYRYVITDEGRDWLAGM
jgi:predicted transcriptional regulator